MNDLKKHLNIELDGVPYKIVDYQHVKPGKGAAYVRTKIKSLLDGRVIDKTFHAGDKAEVPNLDRKNVQFSYIEEDYYNFMDMETYDMLALTEDQVGDVKNYLLDGMECDIFFHNNKAIAVEPPAIVDLLITETQISSKGDRAGSCRKPATLETGAVVTIPCHLNEGDRIRVDTKTGDYLEKVK